MSDEALHILVPMDLNGDDIHHLLYAAEIGQKTELPVRLQYTASPFAATASVPNAASMPVDAGFHNYLKEAEHKLQNIRLDVNRQFGKEVITDVKVVLDMKVDAIVDSASKSGCVLLVMNAGDSYSILDHLSGAIEEQIAKKTNIPIALVSSERDIHAPQHFMLSDINCELDHTRARGFLGFVEAMESKFSFLQVTEEGKDFQKQSDKVKDQLTYEVHESIFYEVTEISDADPVSATTDTFQESKADTLVLQYKDAGLIQRILGKSRTEKVLDKADAPVWLI